MKHILLFLFLSVSTCMAAQQLSNSFVQGDDYGIASASYSNTDPTITIFPNPTTDFVTIEDKDGVISTAIIFNLLGKEIATIDVEGTGTYDMMDHHKGIYLVQLKDKQGQIIQTVRLKKI